MSHEDELQRWENETLAKTIKRFPERKAEFTTISGLPLPRLLTPSGRRPRLR